MKNLGKISLFLILLTSSIFASVTAQVQPRTVYAGDTATYILTVDGSDIQKPIINDICGNDIVATSSQTSIRSINGDYKKSYTLSYQFVPRKSCRVAGTEVKIDSNVEVSNSVNVTVKPRTQDLNADFILSLKASKKELFVGEPFTLTLLLKQKHNASAVDSKFIAPDFKGFWVKSEGKAQRSEEGDFIVTKVVYELASQREGTQSIKPAQLKIATRVGANNWGTLIPQVKWRTYYSNELEIVSKALPNNAKIVGDFSINATAQKLEVNPNEAVNVTVSVVGKGNLEDIESFKPYLKDVNVFDEKIEINGDKLTQKLVFVSERDFTIPSFELAFYNTRTSRVEKIVTKPIDIKVRGNVKKSEVKITRDETPVVVEKKETITATKSVEKDYIALVMAFIVGLFIGIALMLLKNKKATKKAQKLDIKNEKLLLVKLLPFKDEDSDVASIVEVLEHNIYAKDKKSVDKKLLKEMIAKYDIS